MACIPKAYKPFQWKKLVPAKQKEQTICGARDFFLIPQKLSYSGRIIRSFCYCLHHMQVT
jgi:hypothetical protein